jgi:hypothetical protein
MKKGQSNIYKPELIKAIGAEVFFDLGAPQKPIPTPDLGFSDAEWDAMTKHAC